jgi:hypothetical protein
MLKSLKYMVTNCKGVPYLLTKNENTAFLYLYIVLGVDIWSEDLMAGSTLTVSHLDIDVLDC